MSRKSIFSDFQVKEMKEIIRTGEPIVTLAERLAIKYNVSEPTMRTKLYSIAKSTYKIAEWSGPKRRIKKKEEEQEPQETSYAAKRVVMYEDHIRIYF
jgi:hypothetical protein